MLDIYTVSKENLIKLHGSPSVQPYFSLQLKPTFFRSHRLLLEIAETQMINDNFTVNHNQLAYEMHNSINTKLSKQKK